MCVQCGVMASTVTMCVRRDATVGTMVDEHKVHGRGMDERDIHILSSSNLTIGIANLHSVWAISHLYTTSISLQLRVVLSAEGVCVERSLSSAVWKGAWIVLLSLFGPYICPRFSRLNALHSSHKIEMTLGLQQLPHLTNAIVGLHSSVGCPAEVAECIVDCVVGER